MSVERVYVSMSLSTELKTNEAVGHDVVKRYFDAKKDTEKSNHRRLE
jgi:hypothetical protein